MDLPPVLQPFVTEVTHDGVLLGIPVPIDLRPLTAGLVTMLAAGLPALVLLPDLVLPIAAITLVLGAGVTGVLALTLTTRVEIAVGAARIRVRYVGPRHDETTVFAMRDVIGARRGVGALILFTSTGPVHLPLRGQPAERILAVAQLVEGLREGLNDPAGLPQDVPDALRRLEDSREP